MRFTSQINPVLAGKGNLDEMLIREGALTELKLTDSHTFGSGVVMLTTYHPIR